MRVADYIMSFISENLGIDTIFMLSGGGIMHLMDGVACNKKIKYICSHNEQATTMQADGYAKINKKLGVALVTTGPGATNAITGVVGAWQDSTPMLVLSGQSKRKQTIYNSTLNNLRQFGSQEVNIIPLIESVTKYSVMVNEPKDIKYHLEKAAFLMKYGRPGPVWLDIPLDVQGALIDIDKLRGFNPIEEKYYKLFDDDKIQNEVEDVLSLIEKAKRPIIVAGNGINIANANKEFDMLIKQLNIPVATPRLGIDLMDSQNPLYVGKLGVKGDRAGNFAVQNADLVLTIGTRLSINTIGHEYEKFAREAKKIVVDIDKVEHKKPTINIDKFILCDALVFLKKMLNESLKTSIKVREEWVLKCNEWKNKYPVTLNKYKDTTPINTYYFTDKISKYLNKNDVIIIDSGSSSYVVSQSIRIKKGQRFLASGGLGSMGYAIPAAIGASASLENKRVICITGDGSFHMNIQELQTIAHYKLPIKIFVYNNNGYASIKTTQNNYFDSRYIGVDDESGVSMPDLLEIAKVYKIKGIRIKDVKNVDKFIQEVLNYDGPVICEVICGQDQKIVPTVFSQKKEDGTMVSKPLEDMFPFLNRDEFESQMIIKPLDE